MEAKAYGVKAKGQNEDQEQQGSGRKKVVGWWLGWGAGKTSLYPRRRKARIRQTQAASLAMTLEFTWVPRAPSVPQTPAGRPQTRVLVGSGAGFHKDPISDNTEAGRNWHRVIWADKTIEHEPTGEYSETLELGARLWCDPCCLPWGREGTSRCPFVWEGCKSPPLSHSFHFLP